MEVCHIIVLFLIALLIYTHYTMNNQECSQCNNILKRCDCHTSRDENKPIVQVGTSLSSHDSALRPTRI